MKCECCGREVPFNHRFCDYCGANNPNYVETKSDRNQVNPYHNLETQEESNFNNSSTQFTQNNNYLNNRRLASGKVTAAKVFIIIGMVLNCFLIYPLVVGILALNKIKEAKTKDELITVGVLTLIFCNIIGGILILSINEQDFVN